MQIRKSTLRYLKCQGGNLHFGELMNLICVDQRCNYRGLICPICKLQSHDDHYILPIKAFLDQIATTFLNQEQREDINSVGDYLRCMETAKKEVTELVRKEILELSELFKELQVKIEDYYLSLRRNVLLQSTITTKLPNLLHLLQAQNHHSELDIQQQFKKYCELLKYKDNRLVFSDGAKKLVQLFQGLPERFQKRMKDGLDLFRREIKGQRDLLAVQKIDEQLKAAPVGYKFSAKEKSENITLQADDTIAKAKDKGFVFLDKTLTNTQPLTFKLLHQQQQQILIGIGDRSKFQLHHYNNNQEQTCIQFFVTSNGNTLISSFYSEDQKEEEDGFFAFSTGARIQVRYDCEGERVVFTHLDTLETFSLKLKESLKDSEKWNLFFGISQNDSIQLQPPSSE